MADLRKDFSTKVEEKIKPDADKGIFERAKEAITDDADKLGKQIQKDNEKISKEFHKETERSGLQKAKDKVSEAFGK